MVTRAREQADALAARLRALGAGVVELPTIEIRPPADRGPLDRAIAELSHLRLADLHQRQRRALLPGSPGPSAQRPARAARKICAIGPATRAAVEALHLKVDLMGKEYVAESLLEAFAAHDLAGKRILLPRAAVARDLVPVELARRGAQVDVVEAYRTVAPEDLPPRRREIFAHRAGLHHLHQFLHRAELRGCGRSCEPCAACPWRPSVPSPRRRRANWASKWPRRRTSSPSKVLWRPCSSCTLK